MRKFVLNTAAIILASTFSVASFADSGSKEPGSGPNPFTDCGIGAALFPNTHWAAVSSNVIWDVGITAVTSATLSPQTCSGKKVKVALFIRDTHEQLAEELARGEGKHLTAALDMFQCGAAQRQQAIAAARSGLGQVVAMPGYAEQSQLGHAGQLYNIVESAANQACAV